MTTIRQYFRCGNDTFRREPDGTISAVAGPGRAGAVIAPAFATEADALAWSRARANERLARVPARPTEDQVYGLIRDLLPHEAEWQLADEFSGVGVLAAAMEFQLRTTDWDRTREDACHSVPTCYNSSMGDYLSVPDVARRAKCSRQLVSRWCRDGLLPGAYRVGRQWLVPRTALDSLPDLGRPGRPKHH